MEGIESRRPIIDIARGIRISVEWRVGGKGTVQLTKLRRAIIINRESKKGLLLEIKGSLGLALCGLLKLVHLPARHQR